MLHLIDEKLELADGFVIFGGWPWAEIGVVGVEINQVRHGQYPFRVIEEVVLGCGYCWFTALVTVT